MKITVILEEGPNNWGAYTPNDIGCVIVTAPTREEVITQFRSALDFHLRGMREDGFSAGHHGTGNPRNGCSLEQHIG